MGRRKLHRIPLRWSRTASTSSQDSEDSRTSQDSHVSQDSHASQDSVVPPSIGGGANAPPAAPAAAPDRPPQRSATTTTTAATVGKNLRTAVIIARHAERLDYAVRGDGRNWVTEQKLRPDGDGRPWDPPLSPLGLAQSRLLGKRLSAELRNRGLPPLREAYSSPMMRCVQTAAAALRGAEDEGAERRRRERLEMLKNGRHVYGWGRQPVPQPRGKAGGALGVVAAAVEVEGDAHRPKVRVEEGLMESLKEKWYRSWCLPGSDSTWGYLPSPPDETRRDVGEEGPVAERDVEVVVEVEVGVGVEVQEEPTGRKESIETYSSSNGSGSGNGPAEPLSTTDGDEKNDDEASADGGNRPAESSPTAVEDEKKDDDSSKSFATLFDNADVHPVARAPIQGLISTPSDIARRLTELDKVAAASCTTAPPPAPLADLVDRSHASSLCPIGIPYRWGLFEPTRHQSDRVAYLIHRIVAEVHPGQTVLLVTHGGPMAHMYGRLTGGDWKVEHGVSRYTAFDMYEYLPGEDQPREDQDAAAAGDRAGADDTGDGGAAGPRFKPLVVNCRDHLSALQPSPRAEGCGGAACGAAGRPPRVPKAAPVRGIKPMATYKVNFY